MFIPKNGTMRLDRDVWLIAEAFNRYGCFDNIRTSMETAVRTHAAMFSTADPEFSKVLKQVRAEDAAQREAEAKLEEECK